jgi:hypothetical protein
MTIKVSAMEDFTRYDIFALKIARDNIEEHLYDIDQILHRLLHLNDPAVRETYHHVYDQLRQHLEAERVLEDLAPRSGVDADLF